MNSDFEKHKLQRFIKTHGREWVFTKRGKNDFGEPTGDQVSVTVSGVYHETQGYVTQDADTGATIKTKPSSFIMCLVEEAEGVTPGMETTVGGKAYRVVDLRDVENFGVVYDISIELVLS